MCATMCRAKQGFKMRVQKERDFLISLLLLSWYHVLWCACMECLGVFMPMSIYLILKLQSQQWSNKLWIIIPDTGHVLDGYRNTDRIIFF